MILSAETLDCWDRCERRFAFSRKWIPKSISPLGLLYKAVESAIIAPDPEQTAKDKTLELAKQFEIQTDENAFMVTRHVGYLAAIVAVALQAHLGQLKPVGAVNTADFDWQSGLFETTSGERHRIELMGHVDPDRIRAVAHAWTVIGELAALQKGLTLTTVAIGPWRGGRRHSAWSRAFAHPQNHTLRFKPHPGWETIWREQRDDIQTVKWIYAIHKEIGLDNLIISRSIPFDANDNRIKEAQRDMVEIMNRMNSLFELPIMNRNSCDDPIRGACPFQQYCWSPQRTVLVAKH